ncbi:hypothetical protein QOT17_007723 [Balamuthia mandrillaris]
MDHDCRGMRIFVENDGKSRQDITTEDPEQNNTGKTRTDESEMIRMELDNNPGEKISVEPNQYDRRKKETSAEPNCDKNDEKKSAEPIEQGKEAKNLVMELAVEECSRMNTCLKGGHVMVLTDTSHKSARIESAASESSSDQPLTTEYDDMEKQERIT